MSAADRSYPILRNRGPLCLVLIGMCIGLALFSSLGENQAALLPFLIVTPGTSLASELAQGQIWRLFTPMFIHFGILHLLVNMLWMWDLGSLVEKKHGSVFFLIFVLIVGALGNLAQYFFGESILFGGMSGVIYGLLGFVWIRATNPQYGIQVNKQIVVMMLIWFVACWSGLIGNVANWAHTAGLLVGVLWGLATRNMVRR